MIKFKVLLFLLLAFFQTKAEDGYDLWLRYKPVDNASLKAEYVQALKAYSVAADKSPTIQSAVDELSIAMKGMLGVELKYADQVGEQTLVLGTSASSPYIASLKLQKSLDPLGDEGYMITTKKGNIIIAANTDIGVLYGTFHFLRLLQTQQSIKELNITSTPKVKLRVLNHWDNLDRTVERGYAGFSLWDWHRLPDYIDSHILIMLGPTLL
ncbi:alpha-glucuronidase family glycosyl hydrolase [Fulvivirga maritima]|uniref:alpha-glucuronidase family glycosyl hydrolase n=1 Tax=Fulvivirga maritima TaxID=2904247 RepID=UPI0027959FB7|nr:alpha-glucuronidase family glycosyl hydrolase [Fulvivirga maritima]